jgi:hypothetical protein
MIHSSPLSLDPEAVPRQRQCTAAWTAAQAAITASVIWTVMGVVA